MPTFIFSLQITFLLNFYLDSQHETTCFISLRREYTQILEALLWRPSIYYVISSVLGCLYFSRKHTVSLPISFTLSSCATLESWVFHRSCFAFVLAFSYKITPGMRRTMVLQAAVNRYRSQVAVNLGWFPVYEVQLQGIAGANKP